MPLTKGQVSITASLLLNWHLELGFIFHLFGNAEGKVLELVTACNESRMRLKHKYIRVDGIS